MDPRYAPPSYVNLELQLAPKEHRRLVIEFLEKYYLVGPKYLWKDGQVHKIIDGFTMCSTEDINRKVTDVMIAAKHFYELLNPADNG